MSTYHLGNFCIDEARPMRVVVIGAGYGGIISGIRLRQNVKNIDLTIYESHSGVGGTWFVNKYPGLACDIPSHCYQLTFETHKKWSKFYASGPEILQYVEGVADKYKLRPFIKFQHRVVGLHYNETSGKWHISVTRPTALGEGKTETIEDTADAVFFCVGNLNIPAWPDIPGLNTFQGELIHSAAWRTKEGEGAWEDTVKTWGDKRVGVIGVGSSAIQIVPSLQPRVKKLVNFARGKAWISATWAKERLLELSNNVDVPNYVFSEQDLQRFEDDAYYQAWRLKLENAINLAYLATINGHPIQKFAQEEFRKDMLKRLEKKPWIADYLIPDFSIGCRRLTPGPGYLEALCEDNCNFVPTPIKQILPNGIELVDGAVQELDVVVCATGFDTSCRYGFPVIGRSGVDLADKYTPFPKTYLGVATDGFPNFFHVYGPNSSVGSGSLLLLIERQAEYAVQAVMKMQRERLKSIEVKREVVNDFDQYTESYFPRTVFGQKCRSWYKVGKSEDGRVISLWPGSPLHGVKSLQYPRWEDYIYERLDGDGNNRLYFLGQGDTVADLDPEANKAWYILPENINYPPLPE